jgi:hypothetical protein
LSIIGFDPGFFTLDDQPDATAAGTQVPTPGLRCPLLPIQASFAAFDRPPWDGAPCPSRNARLCAARAY